MMKSCPTCNRTFEETLTFCLVDGSILSPPYDPDETRVITASRQTTPPSMEDFSVSTYLLPTAPPRPRTKPAVLWLQLILAIVFALVASVLVTVVAVNVMYSISPYASHRIAVIYPAFTLVTFVVLLVFIFRWWRRRRHEL